MKYRKLGSTDIDVSLIGLGSMTWGEQNTPEEGVAQMDMARDYGVNFIDVAEMYPVPPRAETFGASERIVGDWLAARGLRDKVVLATKVTGRSDRNTGLGHVRGGARLNAAQIVAACEASLDRLKTDYIDLYQVHWPERATNFFGRLDYERQAQEDDGYAIEETLTALSTLVRDGKVRYLGISNETPWGVMEYLRVSRELGAERIVSIQNPYNLLNRSFDVGLGEMSLRERVSLLAYSPLAFGVLSGKYLNGQKPEKARLTLYERFTRYTKEYASQATQAYVGIARRHGLDPSQMALAWVNARAHVASNIIGATTLEQLKANLESVAIELNGEVLAEIDAVHQQYSNPAP